MNGNIRKIAFVFAVAMLYSNAYAATTFTTSTTTSVGAQQVKPSNNVSIVCASVSTQYAAKASHNSGDRQYGTNSTLSKIYWSTGTTISGVTATDVYTGSGWSAL